MQQSLKAMQLALRVLAALTENRYPDPQDVAELRKLAPEAPQEFGVAELACEVIQRKLSCWALSRVISASLPLAQKAV